jgi:hypothetical protein
MTPSDSLTDSLDRSWTLARSLTRTSWARSWLVEGSGGRRAALWAPLGSADLDGSDELADLCRVAMGQAESRLRRRRAGDPELLATVDLGPSGRGLLLPHGPSLLQRIDSGGTLLGALEVVRKATALLEEAEVPHGGIHPAEITLGEGGSVRFGLPLPGAVLPHLGRLEQLAGRNGWRPPERSDKVKSTWDTWALCCLVWATASAPGPNGDVQRPRLETAPVGPDKVALATLKDRVMARLAQEQSNPRFRARVAERLAALLNRGLSAEHEPSPPYRFTAAADLRERITEVLALAQPRIDEVGRVILGGDTGASTFQGGEAVKVAVSVGCTARLADHEDVVAGLRLTDLDAPGDGRVPLEEAKFGVKTHPSGRLRFEFTLPELSPGRYEVRCAFAVKDSGHEPKVAHGRFEVRPPPGYVPPAEEPGAAPLSLSPLRAPAPVDDDEEDDSDAETVRMGAHVLQHLLDDLDDTLDTEQGDEPEPVGEVIEGVFPRPIAPPSDPDPEPEPAPRPAMEAQVQLDPETAPGASVTAFPNAPTTPPVTSVPRPDPSKPPPPLAAVPTPPPTAPSEVDATVPVAQVPPAAAPYPTAATPSEPGSDDFPAAGGGMEAPSLGSAWMAASSGEADTSDWSDGPGLGGGDLLNDGGEDLPTWEGPGPAGSPLDQLKAVLFRDTYTAVVAASAVCLLLVLVFALALRAC